jgi:hypothetical protein
MTFVSVLPFFENNVFLTYWPKYSKPYDESLVYLNMKRQVLCLNFGVLCVGPCVHVLYVLYYSRINFFRKICPHRPVYLNMKRSSVVPQLQCSVCWTMCSCLICFIIFCWYANEGAIVDLTITYRNSPVFSHITTRVCGVWCATWYRLLPPWISSADGIAYAAWAH